MLVCTVMCISAKDSTAESELKPSDCVSFTLLNRTVCLDCFGMNTLPAYSGAIFQSAVDLGRYLQATYPDSAFWRHKRVVELGCGVGGKCMHHFQLC